MKLFINSGMSYEEVVEFLKAGMAEEQLTKITQKKRDGTLKKLIEWNFFMKLRLNMQKRGLFGALVRKK